MPTLNTNDSGKRGELLVELAFSRVVMGNFRRPLFRASPLGDKYPAADFIVALLGPREAVLGYLCAQSKASQDATSRSVPIACSKKQFSGLIGIPMPTFFVATELKTEKSYILAAGTTRAVKPRSVPTRHDLGKDDVLIKLYREVLNFWKTVDKRAWRSSLR